MQVVFSVWLEDEARDRGQMFGSRRITPFGCIGPCHYSGAGPISALAEAVRGSTPPDGTLNLVEVRVREGATYFVCEVVRPDDFA